MLIVKFHSHLVTYQHREPVLFYYHLVTSTEHTCTHNADGDKFNISLRNFGHVGEINFFRAFISDKNGIQKNETLKLMA